jgi:hypothetical protein
MPSIPNRWTMLRLRFPGPLALCRYTDSLGNSRSFSSHWRLWPPSSIWLWSGEKTLGEAMTGIRRRAVNRGNPLGLVSHAAGDVDLMVN